MLAIWSLQHQKPEAQRGGRPHRPLPLGNVVEGQCGGRANSSPVQGGVAMKTRHAEDGDKSRWTRVRRLTLGDILKALFGSHDCGSCEWNLDHKRCLRPRTNVENGRWGCVCRQNGIQWSRREPWRWLLKMGIERNTRPNARLRKGSSDLGILGGLLILDGGGLCWLSRKFRVDLKPPGL